MTQGRRWKCVRVGELEFVDAWFSRDNRPGMTRVEVVSIGHPQVPEDAEVVGVWHEPAHKCFVVALSHPSWPEVPSGLMIPYLGDSAVVVKTGVLLTPEQRSVLESEHRQLIYGADPVVVPKET